MISRKQIAFEKLSGPQKKGGEFRRVFRVFITRKVVLMGLFIIVATVITAIFAPALAPYDPYTPDLKNTLCQPCLKHLLGTDAMGRDTLSRVIYGTRISLLVGLAAIGGSGVWSARTHRGATTHRGARRH